MKFVLLDITLTVKHLENVLLVQVVLVDNTTLNGALQLRTLSAQIVQLVLLDIINTQVACMAMIQHVGYVIRVLPLDIIHSIVVNQQSIDCAIYVLQVITLLQVTRQHVISVHPELTLRWGGETAKPVVQENMLQAMVLTPVWIVLHVLLGITKVAAIPRQTEGAYRVRVPMVHTTQKIVAEPLDHPIVLHVRPISWQISQITLR